MAASSGDSHPYPIYNARYRVVLPILDATGGLVAGATGLDSELSQDQGTFADATNEATQIATSSGLYYLDLIATELDTKSTAVIVKSTEGKTTPLVLYPKRLPVIRTGTAQAGAASTITLDSGASAVDDYYNGCYVNITNDTPSGVRGQARLITDYVGSTKVATVEAAWGTNPSSSSTFEILVPETVNVTAWAGTAVDDPATVGIPDVAVTGTPSVNCVQISGDTTAADNAEAFFDGTGYAGGTAKLDVNVVQISGDATAADNAEAFFDGTGYAGGTAKLDVNVVQISGDATAADNAEALFDNSGFNAAASTIGTATAIAAGGITASSIAADAIGASELAADAVAEIADGILDRNLATGTDSGTETLRTVRQALRALRNRFNIAGTTRTVYKEDDTTASWTSTVQTNASAEPIVGDDPAS